jgi:hypothetical protein
LWYIERGNHRGDIPHSEHRLAAGWPGDHRKALAEEILMKRLTSVSGIRLIVLTLGIGCLAVLALMLWASNPASASQPFLVPMAPSPTSPSPVNCTNTYTTTADTIGVENGNSFINAVFLAPYTDLSLVGTVGIGGSKPTFPEYFRLDNTVPGSSYKIEAVPNLSTNYNLRIVIFDNNYNVVASDPKTTPDYKGSVTFVPTSIGPYFLQVYQYSSQCSGGTYDLNVTYTGPTATPTSTPTPTGSPTVTPSPTPTTQPWTVPDQYDSSIYAPDYNDYITRSVALGASTTSGLTLYNAARYPSDPGSDQDWYTLYGVTGYQYSVIAGPDTSFINPYLFVEVFAPDNKVTPIGQKSDNTSISWTASSTGSYFIHIARASGSPTNGTYHVTWTTNAPTATPTTTATPTPGPGTPTDTPVPGLDAFEPNWDFDHAAGIGLNVKYTNINFVPLPGQSVNNDYFKIRVKTGMLVTCETLDLSAGTDTNMILYDDNRQGLAGNDDVDRARGELRSRVTVSINYDGFLYILVGQGYAVPNSQSAQYTYSLQCTVGAGQVTATPTVPPASTSAPVFAPTYTPPVPTQAPPPTSSPATAMPPISVRALPTPMPAGPVQQMVTADLQVYYDANDNGIADPGEGVVGLPARVYDATTGALLAQGFTNDTGHAVFNVPAAGSVRVVVPYLGFEATVPPSGAAIPVLISPRELPKQIP